LTTTYPATGQTGTINSQTTNAYLYVGGPLTSTTFFDESNTQVRQVTLTYGLEGESLAVAEVPNQSQIPIMLSIV
jgi:hypothetical protein